MELEMEHTKREVEELKVMYNDAITCRDQAQTELKHHENVIYAERKKREQELYSLKKEAEEKIQQHERIERRIAARSTLGMADDREDAANASAEVMEEQQQQITSFEMAFKRIKEATGVSDLNEVVLRFENQGSTREHLEQLKVDSENEITRLREEKDAVTAEFNEMKYTGDAKLSSGQRILEEYQKKLADEMKRRDDLIKHLDRSSGVLVKAKSGVGHLADKVTHIKVTRGSTPQAKVDVNSDEFVLDQLGLCEEKLLKLMDKMQGYDMDEILRKMQREEFFTQIENKLPSHNTRVKLPQNQRDKTFDDEEESGDEDGEVLTRQALKKQSEMLVDQKTKKRQPRKKKKAGK
jgi:coiled-coil domain-containing protein 151